MITLNEYKYYLLNNYKYEIDSLPERVKEREQLLTKFYSDEFLNKIINDTYEFTIDIFNCDTLEYGYCKFEIDNDFSCGIDLMISGGGYSDYLFKDSYGRVISEHILKIIFGDLFCIEIKDDEIERECEEGVFSFDYNYSIYMQGFPTNMDEIKEKILNNIRTFKKI